MTLIPDNRKIDAAGSRQVKGVEAGASIPNDGFVYVGLNGAFEKSINQGFEIIGTGTANLVDSVLNVTYTYGSTFVQVESHKLLGIKKATVFLDGIASSGSPSGGELRLFSDSPSFFGINTDPSNCIFKILEFSGTDYTELDVALFNPDFQNISGEECLRFRRKVDPSNNMPPFTSTDATIVIYIWSYDN